MSIPVISNFYPRNSGTFYVVDGPYVRGVYRAVATTGDLNNIYTDVKATGQLIYVQSENRNYRWVSGVWRNDFVANEQFNQVIGGATGYRIIHGMGYIPNVSCFDASGNQIFGQISHSATGFDIKFNQYVSGIVYCS